MNFFCLLIFALFILQIVAQQVIDVSENYELKREPVHSFGAPLLVSMNKILNWPTYGNVIIEDDRIKLTQNEKSLSGRITNDIPLGFSEFEIYLQTYIGNDGSIGADGLGIWLTSNSPIPGGPIFGGPAKWQGILIALDTFDNDKDYDSPSINLIQNNNDFDYPPGTDPKAVGRVTGSCQINYRNKNLELRIAVVGGRIQLMHKLENSKEWSLCFNEQLTVSLSRPFLSLTAATGDISDNHVVYTVQTRRLTPKHLGVDPSKPQITPPQQQNTHGFNAETEIIQELKKYTNTYQEEIRKNREEMRLELIKEHKQEDIQTEQFYEPKQNQLPPQNQNQPPQNQFQPPQNQFQPPQNQFQPPQNQYQSQDLEAIKANQQYIINTLNSLSNQINSQKETINGLEAKIRSFPISNNNQFPDVSNLRSKIEAQEGKLDQTLNAIRSLDIKLEKTTENSNRFNLLIKKASNDVMTALTETSQGSFGYFFYFILTQVVFAFAWFWYTKSSRKRPNF